MANFIKLFSIVVLLQATILTTQSQDVLKLQSGYKIVVDAEGKWKFTHPSPKKSNKYDSKSINDPEANKLFQELYSKLLDKDAKTTAHLYLVGNAIDESLHRRNQAANRGKTDQTILNEMDDALEYLHTWKAELNKEFKQIGNDFNQLHRIASMNPSLQDMMSFSHTLDIITPRGGKSVKSFRVGKGRKSTDASFTPVSSDVINDPPETRCSRIAYAGKDVFTGKYRIDTEPQKLFTYTPKEYEDYLKIKPYLNCNIQFSEYGGYYFFTLYLTFHSMNAQSIFGSIRKGSYLNLELINGDNIQLQNIQPGIGSVDQSEGITIYNPSYTVDKSLLNTLKTTEIDRISIQWEKGFDTYEIFEVDAIMHQISCLLNN